MGTALTTISGFFERIVHDTITRAKQCSNKSIVVRALKAFEEEEEEEEEEDEEEEV